jgi:hypothetical protein
MVLFLRIVRDFHTFRRKLAVALGLKTHIMRQSWLARAILHFLLFRQVRDFSAGTTSLPVR